MGIGRIGAGIGLFVASRASEARGVLDGTKEICVWRILSGLVSGGQLPGECAVQCMNSNFFGIKWSAGWPGRLAEEGKH